jgi:peptidoglycan/xylan/chitin deacetylase (PgdA/CDA1 family)
MNIYYKIIRAISCLLIQKKIKITRTAPLISYTFDDAPNSAFTNGKNILKKYGYNGTYYISLGLLDKNRPDGGYFDVNHLREVVQDGGELACHTFNHIHLYHSSKEEILLDLKKNDQSINEIIPGYVFKNFSYPYGEQNIHSKIIIRKKFKSARSIKGGINTGSTDLNNLKSQALGNGDSLEKIYHIIDETIRTNGWLIFFTHDIQSDPSEWGCSPEYFEAVVKYCFEKGIETKTIAEVLKNVPLR